MAATSVRAETVVVLGRDVRVTSPPGYCAVGDSERERQLLSSSQRAMGRDARAVFTAARCEELDELRRGHRDGLEHWVQVQLLAMGGDFRALTLDRETFVARNSRGKQRLDANELNRQLREVFGDKRKTITEVRFDVLGRDANAVYGAITMRMDGSGGPTVTGLSALTLINSLPLSLNAYEATGTTASREQLQPTLRSLLQHVLANN